MFVFGERCYALYVPYVLSGVNALDTFESSGTIGQGTHHFVVWGNCWVGDGFVLELHGVAKSVTVRVFDVACVRAIVLVRFGQVPSVY